MRDFRSLARPPNTARLVVIRRARHQIDQTSQMLETAPTDHLITTPDYRLPPPRRIRPTPGDMRPPLRSQFDLQQSVSGDTLGPSLGSHVTRVIKNRAGFYFKQGGGWTSHFDQAEKFSNTKAAITTTQLHNLHRVDLVLIMMDKPQSQWDVVLPIFD